MIRKASLILAASAMALAAPAFAKPGNGNGNGNGRGNGNGNAPAPTPTRAPPPTLAGCGYTAGVVVETTFYVGCQGFFAGNAISGSAQAAQASGVNGLGGNYTGSWLTKVEAPLSGGLIDFGQPLTGETIVGVHFGNIYNPGNLVLGGQGNNGNVTVFWKFNFGNAVVRGIKLLESQGYSNAALYHTGSVTAVPEPATWAMLVLGFGLLGGAMRRDTRRRGAPLVA